MINSTLDKRITKALKKFNTSELGYKRAEAIHSLIHLLTEVYTCKSGRLNTIEVSYISKLWKEIRDLCEEHINEYYPTYYFGDDTDF
tara:strand:- start:11 stop:271 length:261 start_codon:yes stop_codon:yes gene_type:complete